MRVVGHSTVVPHVLGLARSLGSAHSNLAPDHRLSQGLGSGRCALSLSREIWHDPPVELVGC